MFSKLLCNTDTHIVTEYNRTTIIQTIKEIAKFEHQAHFLIVVSFATGCVILDIWNVFGFFLKAVPNSNSPRKCNIQSKKKSIKKTFLLATECPCFTRRGCRSHLIQQSRKSSFRPERQITDKPLLYFGTLRIFLTKPRCSSSRFVAGLSQRRKRILVLQRDSETSSARSERHLPVASKI